MMVNLSTVRKLSIAARIAAQQAERTRTVERVLKGARATAVHFGRVLRPALAGSHGLCFLALAFIGAVAFFREYTRYKAGQTTPARRTSRNYFSH